MRYDEIVANVNKILSEYSMRLTLRQIYYRLVAGYGLPNKRSSYNQLSSQLVKARENGEVDEDRIEDRTREFLGGDHGFSSPKSFIDAVKNYFLKYWENYSRKLWADQEKYVFVWVEKDALSRVLHSAGSPFKVITAPSKGYASYTYIKEAISRMPYDKDVVILHFADHDPSGIDMTRDLISRFNRYSSSRQIVDVERIALTYTQVKKYDLIPNPTKKSDTRSPQYIAEYGHECWELDAIDPNELQRLVRESVKRHIDWDKWNAAKALEAEERDELKLKFEEWAEALKGVDDNEEEDEEEY